MLTLMILLLVLYSIAKHKVIAEACGKIWGYQDLTGAEQQALLAQDDSEGDGDFERNGPELDFSSDDDEWFIEGEDVSDDEEDEDDQMESCKPCGTIAAVAVGPNTAAAVAACGCSCRVGNMWTPEEHEEIIQEATSQVQHPRCPVPR